VGHEHGGLPEPCLERPELALLLDEPFGALDRSRVEEQREFGRSARLRKTAVFVTHDMREAARVADRIALLGSGQLIALGTPAELAAHADPGCARFSRQGRMSPDLLREIATETGHHVLLVAVSIGIATAIGVPLGIFLTAAAGGGAGPCSSRRRHPDDPELALFGFLIPVPRSAGSGRGPRWWRSRCTGSCRWCGTP